MSRSSVPGLFLTLVALVACRREPAPESATPVPIDSTSSAAPEIAGSEVDDDLPEVHHRGWILVQEALDDSETMVRAWAPGDHLKEAYAVAIPDLFREHFHFAEWSHGSLFAIRRIGDTDTETWTDELWEYRDGHDPRRLASGRGLDFRISPDGQGIAVEVADSANPGSDLVRILDRRGAVRSTRRATAYGRESFTLLAMGDSVAYLGADIDQDLYRWSLGSDSLVAVARPDQALDDLLILPDRDVLVASDLPPIADADEMETFRKAGTPVVLRAFHLRDGKSKELARKAGSGFRPHPGENDSIEFEASTPDSTEVLPPPWP